MMSDQPYPYNMETRRNTNKRAPTCRFRAGSTCLLHSRHLSEVMAGTGERQTLALLQVRHAVSPTLCTHADARLTQGVSPILGGRSLAHVTLVLRCACSQNGGVLVKLCHILSLVTVRA